MNQLKLVVVLLLLFMLSGCSSTLATPDNNQPGPKETHTETLPVPKETRTPVSPTPTVSLKGTAKVDISKNFIDLTSTAFESATADGFLVLGKTDTFTYSLYDIKNKKTIETLDFYFVSPNKKFMLTGACPTGKCDYILRTADKIIKTNIPIDADWAPAGWLDNERVIFQYRFKRDQVVQPKDVMIYNLFTGQKSSIRLDLPNLYLDYKPLPFYPLYFVETSLNPSLKRVAFDDQGGNLVLWNLDTQKKMASLPFADTIGRWLGPDGWSPDGKKFITTSPNKFPWTSSDYIPSANELFMLDVDGNLTQLTHYNQQYQFANVANQLWSPDNRHIAFWLTIGDDASNPNNLQQWLAIFDISTLGTKIYRSTFSDHSTFVWSPDGQQLIVSDLGSNLTLVDLAYETKSMIPDTQDMSVGDWMAP